MAEDVAVVQRWNEMPHRTLFYPAGSEDRWHVEKHLARSTHPPPCSEPCVARIGSMRSTGIGTDYRISCRSRACVAQRNSALLVYEPSRSGPSARSEAVRRCGWGRPAAL